MATTVLLTGGCACGAIRYECPADPLLMWRCHCHACQRATGSAFATPVFVPASELKYTTDEPTYMTTLGGSGNPVHRGFCSACGSPIGGKADIYPDFRAMFAASLDDSSGLAPVAEIWTSSARSWDYLNPDLPAYEAMPSETELQKLMAAWG